VRTTTDLRPTQGRFTVVSDFEPSGDQPTAIKELTEKVNAGEKDVVLHGATGTGKSATTAWLVEQVQRPTLVIAPNKTLAAQLANEFKELLPNNAVEYFVSYYDYYQPEAYVPQTDTYIEKDSSINEEVERLRHSATQALLTRRDVVVVATVSCIYGLGTPEEYVDRALKISLGETRDRDDLLRTLVTEQYTRNDLSFTRGTFRVRGDTIEVFPVYEELAVRIEMFGDEVERLYYPGHPLRGRSRAHGACHRRHRGRARAAAGGAGEAGQAAGGAAAAHAHHLRHRDDAAGRLLLRDRELLAAHRRPCAGLRRQLPDRLLPR
jgi:excinuclease ABC subunit B